MIRKNIPLRNELPTRIKKLINEVALPIKLIIPQPIIARIPGLTTNEDVRLEKVLRHIPSKGRCLDIGCGTNRLVRTHREQGGNGVGVDVHDWGNVDLIVEDSSNLPFEDKSFDCITFVASLNHIPNRLDVLKEAHRLLRDHGVIIITTLNPILSEIWHRWAFWDKDQHERGMKVGEVYGFTDSEVEELLRAACFSVIEKHRFSWGLNRLYVVKRKV